MRKSILLTLVLSLCMADFGAFAAAARGNARGANNAATSNVSAPAAPVAARAGARQKVVSTPTAASNAVSAPAAPVAARAGARQKVVSTPKPSAGQPMAARAGATQKVVSNGTKVAAATNNTLIPQECQDGFFGCMDSFCMIDNEAGGRCQCSDRNAELKTVMDEIAKLDEQSYIMATEGVKRIEMGENADAIIAAAKAAGDKATGKATDTNIKAGKESKKYELDLSAWNNSIFSEDEDEDVFQAVDVNVDSSVVNNALAKTGNALYTDSAKLCLAQMPNQCSSHLKILQNMYAQKIRSDCTAFENKLKQDKIASSQKVRAAEEALRNAALTDFQNRNKYNLGGCVQEYAKCMKNECGSDYAKCITLSAQENMKGGAGDKNARTIKGVVDIVLSGSTMNQLMSKKTICDDEVLVHCENYRAQVWDKYIEGAATELKSAELSAEDNMRQNCIKTTADCFRNSCAAQWSPESDATNYDMCLSDPMLVFDSCKIQVEACVAATGGEPNVKKEEDLAGSRLWTGVKSMLAALRVDACSKELKTQIEKICGDDYSHCVGLNPGSIAELVPTDTLTACTENNETNNKQGVLEYISQIAQGYALKIHDELYARCEAGAKEAMISVCGDEDRCEALSLGNMSFDSLLKVDLCVENEKKGTLDCHKSADDFSQSDIVLGHVTPHIRNRVNINNIVYVKKNQPIEVYGTQPVNKSSFYLGRMELAQDITKSVKATDDGFYYVGTYGGEYASEAEITSILKGLTNLLNNKMAVMKESKVVKECMEGKKVTGFRTMQEKTSTDTTVKELKQSKIGNATGETQDKIYINLLDSYKQILISRTLDLIKEKYDQAEKDLEPEINSANEKISARLATIEGLKAEEFHKKNRFNCLKKALEKNIEANTVGKNATKPDIKDKGGVPYTESGSACKFDYGYCSKGERVFFNTGAGRNYNREALYWTEGSYDESNSTCTLTTTKYTCTNYLSPYCWSWDTAGAIDGTPSVEKMPSINKEDLIQDMKRRESIHSDNY